MDSIAQLLTPARCLCRVSPGSKKQLFELVADTLAAEQEEAFHAAELVSGLQARERLGSTAMGEGIALPHCRLRDCEEAAGVLITLAEPMPFDAPDNTDVDLVFALVVPQEATQEHLNLLADLARLFSRQDFCDALRDCSTSTALCATAIDWASRVS